MYSLVINPITGKLACISKVDGSIKLLIPFNPDNTDYQAYLAWLAEGNEPLPADELTTEEVTP